MTNQTREFLHKELLSIHGRKQTQQRHIKTAQEEFSGTKEFNAEIDLYKLDNEKESFLQELNTDNLHEIEHIANIITAHSLKIIARGKLVKDEQGNHTYTHGSNYALRLLVNPFDTSRIVEDLRQEVACNIFEAIKQGKVKITTDTDNKRVKLTLTDENDKKTLRKIYNTVQNFLYQNQQKHNKRNYIPCYNDNGVETKKLQATAMKEYELSMQAVELRLLFESLETELTTPQQAVLMAMCEFKQVERKHTSNDKNNRHFVTRKKTVVELASATGLSIQNVRTAQKHIQRKLRDALAN